MYVIVFVYIDHSRYCIQFVVSNFDHSYVVYNVVYPLSFIIGRILHRLATALHGSIHSLVLVSRWQCWAS